MNDNTFDALADERRRALLVELFEETAQDGTLCVPETVDRDPLQSRQRLETMTYHTHLPKLDEYGFVRWNRDTDEIDRGPRFDDVRPLLRLIARRSAADGNQHGSDRQVTPTETHRELLAAAVENGYFRTPRKTTLVELADTVGISSREASEYLLEGIDSVLREYFDFVE